MCTHMNGSVQFLSVCEKEHVKVTVWGLIASDPYRGLELGT